MSGREVAAGYPDPLCSPSWTVLVTLLVAYPPQFPDRDHMCGMRLELPSPRPAKEQPPCLGGLLTVLQPFCPGPGPS